MPRPSCAAMDRLSDDVHTDTGSPVSVERRERIFGARGRAAGMNPRRSAQSEPGILEQLVAESDAMARYALASGLTVPASVLQIVATATGELIPVTGNSSAGAGEPAT